MAFSNFFKQPIRQNNFPIFGNEEEKIIKYFNEIYQHIRDGAKNEKFVVVVGENHTTQHSLFHEALILLALSMTGNTRDLLIEGTENELMGWLLNAKKFELLNMPKMVEMACQYGWDVHSMEKNTKLTDEERNHIMAEFVTRFPRSCMVILGMDHFYSVIDLLEKRGVSVLGVKTSTEGCDLVMLPSYGQTIDCVRITQTATYVMQVNEDQKWMLYGIHNQTLAVITANHENALATKTYKSTQIHTQKYIVPEMTIDDLNSYDFDIDVGNGDIRFKRLLNNQIAYLHSKLLPESKETLLADEVLRFTKQKNIIQTSRFSCISAYKNKDTINATINFIIKMLSRKYTLTCRLDSLDDIPPDDNNKRNSK